KAVAMWLDGGQSLMAAETGTDERWSAPQSVTATAWARFDIQTNRAGQRVALALEYPQGGTEPAPQVVFYRPETGWSARILAKGRLMDIAMPNDVGNASLTVLEDGSATFVTRENSSSGFSKFPFEALRVLQDGTQSVVLEGLGLDRTGQLLTNGSSAPLGAAFAVAPRSGEMPPYGYLVYQNIVAGRAHQAVDLYGTVNITGALVIRPQTTMSATNIDVFSDPNYWASKQNCVKDLVRAASVDDLYAVALSAGISTASGAKCSLNATRINRFVRSNGDKIKTDALSAADASVETAQLMMDSKGNSLVIWREKATSTSKPRYMWSQSLGYGTWTFPADISSSLALGENVLKGLEVRLNDQGRAVAAIATQVLDEKGSSLRRNVSYAKFDFQNGWGKPVEIAKFSGLQSSEIEISAAINHAGKAMVTYQLPRCFVSQNSNECRVSSMYSYSL
ncbi:MAG TPA: hypothetical protein VKS80_10705, partial [Trinickia sp.]|nr:hypothetical protein [Trinickia sp.]